MVKYISIPTFTKWYYSNNSYWFIMKMLWCLENYKIDNICVDKIKYINIDDAKELTDILNRSRSLLVKYNEDKEIDKLSYIDIVDGNEC